MLVRNIRRDAIDEIKQAEKDKSLSQKMNPGVIKIRCKNLPDKYIKIVDDITSAKTRGNGSEVFGRRIHRFPGHEREISLYMLGLLGRYLAGGLKDMY